jgi:hypothetical protein
LNALAESNPKILYVAMPIIWLIPKRVIEIEKKHVKKAF